MAAAHSGATPGLAFVVVLIKAVVAEEACGALAAIGSTGRH